MVVLVVPTKINFINQLKSLNEIIDICSFTFRIWKSKGFKYAHLKMKNLNYWESY